MRIPEKFKNFFWGENKLFFPEEEFVIKLSYPRVFVRYSLADGYFATFEEFFQNIAEIQYLDGERPGKKQHEEILIDIWNYIALEERQLETDLEAAEDDDFFDDDFFDDDYEDY